MPEATRTHALYQRMVELEERLLSAETTLAHAEAFIEHQDMSYRWAEWCEGRDPDVGSSDKAVRGEGV